MDPRGLSFIGHTAAAFGAWTCFDASQSLLRSYWVLVVMDQFTRRLVGVGVQCGAVTGARRLPHVQRRHQAVPLVQQIVQ
jgi:putative transposase